MLESYRWIFVVAATASRFSNFKCRRRFALKHALSNVLDNKEDRG